MSAIPAPLWQPGFGLAIPALLRDFFRPGPAEPPASPDETRARLDFAREMLDRNPEAFASEEDVRAMMLLYPRHF
jgi:hypothetical protein